MYNPQRSTGLDASLGYAFFVQLIVLYRNLFMRAAPLTAEVVKKLGFGYVPLLYFTKFPQYEGSLLLLLTSQFELLFTLKEEIAVKLDYIEEIYTHLMHPAVNLLSPDAYARIPVADIGSKEMEQVENWFYNYGLALAVSEFEKM